MDQFARSALLLGADGMRRLREARVAVFGLGGVGGYAAEALVRGGVGAVDLIDHDTVSLTNLNRQIIATRDTLGQKKTDAAAARLRSIAPDVRITLHDCFYLPENAAEIDLAAFDYVADAVDTVAAKLALAVNCRAAGTPLISAMGAGNRLDPGLLRVADISETQGCPLARVMRRELRRRGIEHLKVVFSSEPARVPEPACDEDRPPEGSSRRSTPGSVSFVPSVMGLMMAGVIIRELALPDEFGGKKHEP